MSDTSADRLIEHHEVNTRARMPTCSASGAWGRDELRQQCREVDEQVRVRTLGHEAMRKRPKT